MSPYVHRTRDLEAINLSGERLMIGDIACGKDSGGHAVALGTIEHGAVGLFRVYDAFVEGEAVVRLTREQVERGNAQLEAMAKASEPAPTPRPTLPRRVLSAVSAAWRWVRELP